LEPTATNYELEFQGRSLLVRLPIVGMFNVYNSLGAVAAAHGLGCNFREAVTNLQKSPQENSEDKLVQLLANNTNATDERAIHEYLDTAIRNDFEKGNTLTVKGWVLAITEARQCALFSLLQN